ncbi:hypothetical protein [Planctomycetes bacterium K23_9]
MQCPIDGTNLANADQVLVSSLNDLIANGQLRDRADQLIREPLEHALINEGGKWAFAIRNRIPSLIADEAIAIPDELRL